MTKEVFVKEKENLTNLVKERLAESDISDENKISLSRLLGLLDQYSFENRLYQKGLLTHTIIDSLEIDYALGEKFITFDQNIS